MNDRKDEDSGDRAKRAMRDIYGDKEEEEKKKEKDKEKDE